MDDYERILELANMLVQAAELTPALWLELLEVIYAPIPENKRTAVTRLFKTMNADERLNSLMLIMLIKAGRLSQTYIDWGVQQHLAAFVMALWITA